MNIHNNTDCIPVGYTNKPRNLSSILETVDEESNHMLNEMGNMKVDLAMTHIRKQQDTLMMYYTLPMVKHVVFIRYTNTT